MALLATRKAGIAKVHVTFLHAEVLLLYYCFDVSCHSEDEGRVRSRDHTTLVPRVEYLLELGTASSTPVVESPRVDIELVVANR